MDPDGLLARTLEVPVEDRKVSNGVYGPQGGLAFSNDPVGDQVLYAETGVSVVAISDTTTYLAQDEAGAKKIVDTFAETMRARKFVPSAPVPGLPSAKCLKYQPDSKSIEAAQVYCVAAAGNVAFEVSSGQEVAAHQRVAAQYLMLTAK